LASQAAKASGNLDLEKLLDMKEAGIEVESFVSEEMRLQMYQKEVCHVHLNCSVEGRSSSMP
jgi:hypothetical protein